MTTAAAAHAYISQCRTSGDPISLAHVTTLTGLRDGSAHRFIVAALADLPVPPKGGKRACLSIDEKWMLLGARIYEASKAERAGRNAECCKRYRARKAIMEVAA